MLEIAKKVLYNWIMKNLREIIPNNIIALRKSLGMTQLDLGKKVNYSDKAVSRWEKGEVLPDIETLQSVSRALNVPLSYLIEEHTETPKNSWAEYQKNQKAFQALMILAVWTIATIIFVFGQIYLDYFYWQIYVWAVPASCVVISYMNRKSKNKKIKPIFDSLFCWSLLASLYLQFLQYNIWLVFIIGVPIQAAIIVAFFAKRKPKIH